MDFFSGIFFQVREKGCLPRRKALPRIFLCIFSSLNLPEETRF
jgi:hypothetical protein